MADIKLIEDLDKLGITITQNELDILRNETMLLQDNLNAVSEVFKIKAVELIERLKSRNVSVEQIVNILLDDFDNDGEIFGGLKRGLFGATDDFVSNVESQATEYEWQQKGYDENETWVAVLVNTCEDCLPRHGMTKPHSEWVSLGLPRSGWSVCKSHCQCQLFPSSITESTQELRDPLKRVKKTITEVAKEKDVVSVKNYVNRKLGTINNTQDPIRKTYRKLLKGFKR